MIDQKILRSENAWTDKDLYQKIYEFSIEHPELYWAAHMDFLSWTKRPSKILEKLDGWLPRWFSDGRINACHNCVDRHAKATPEKTALIWQGDDMTTFENISFKKLKEEVCRFANVIKTFDINQNSYVTIYMPMIPEGVFACLACARLGIRYTVVFSGFSPQALALRMDDCGSDLVISCDASKRGGKIFPIKQNVDKAREICKRSISSLIVRRQNVDVEWNQNLDSDYYQLSGNCGTECEIADTEALSELFMLYTSGSAGRPKGIVHGTGGFLLFAMTTFKYFFNINKDSVFWCSGDIGWLGGHAYSIYAPLANGTTTLIFEGIPTYPSPAVFSEIIDKHQITSFNTAPTAIRALMQHSDEALAGGGRESLRLIGVFGEILNKDAWEWYFHRFGNGRCPLVNMWGQTEIGGVSTAPLCDISDMKHANVGKQFFGCEFVLKDLGGRLISEPWKPGALFIKHSMPGMLLDVFGDKNALKNMIASEGGDETYCTGDGAYVDDEKNIWITGRNDDVLNVSGHRISPIEIEEAIAKAEFVSEISVVGFPHELKGEGIFAFVVLKKSATEEQRKNAQKIISAFVAEAISPITKPDVVLVVDDIPKTISGKIMRRVLRAIASGETENFSDLSTIANPECIKNIIASFSALGS